MSRLQLVVMASALVLVVRPAGAGLPADGWPQARRDAALTGRAPGTALPSARLRWVAYAGAPLTGEPVVLGCTVAVTAEDGVVHAYNARNGAPLWQRTPEADVPLVGVASALAFDDGGGLVAGLPVDPFLRRAWLAVRIIHSALQSYAVDFGDFPPGPDLAPSLTPTYVRELPPNPLTGLPMTPSDVPSPGNYRYQHATGTAEFNLGVWNTDGGLLDLGGYCDASANGHGGLAPDWPRSPEVGGTPTALDAASGALGWSDVRGHAGVVVTPSLLPAHVALAHDADIVRTSSWWWTWGWWGWWWGWQDAAGVRLGALEIRTPSGALVRDAVRYGGCRGAAASDAAGNTWVARGPAVIGELLDREAWAIATAIESYSIDNNAYPETGDLEQHLVPTYLPCLPENLLGGRTQSWSPTPSPGDHDYARSSDGTGYVIAIWGEDGSRVTEIDTGSQTREAQDLPPSVTAYDTSGAERWSVRIGLPTHDVSPLALTADGGIVVGTTGGELVILDAATGAERARTDVGEPLVTAPAHLPDGGIVVVTGNGTAVAHDPDLGERWRLWLGATVTAAPTTTGDGVTYVPDLDGVLHALAADGALLWEVFLGGVSRSGLSTAAVQSDGWLYVGRTDGALVAVVPVETAGRPADPGNVLRPNFIKGPTRAGLRWPLATPPRDPGAHWHLRRWPGVLLGLGDDLLPSHPSAVTDFVDEAALGTLLFYRLHAADCGENESR
jgi:outer membrane protein assembly factor BamB